MPVRFTAAGGQSHQSRRYSLPLSTLSLGAYTPLASSAGGAGALPSALHLAFVRSLALPAPFPTLGPRRCETVQTQDLTISVLLYNKYKTVNVYRDDSKRQMQRVRASPVMGAGSAGRSSIMLWLRYGAPRATQA
eukprot:6210698-Pleurochrysis_carterae.AAC.2